MPLELTELAPYPCLPQGDGSIGGGACCQACQLSWIPGTHMSGRREATPTSCAMTYEHITRAHMNIAHVHG